MDPKNYLTGIGIILFIILIKLVFENNKGTKDYSKTYPKITANSFKIRHSLLNPNERLFFESLKLAIEGKYDIYPQVHLGAIFQPINYGHNWAEINKLNKRIDFVLFDKNTQTPKIAIELDGDSHSKYKSFKRDEFVGEIFNKFNIPLVRFNNGNYSIEEIKKVLSG